MSSTTTADTSQTDLQLDIFGQIPALKSYTNVSSIYAVPDAATRASIVDTLTQGLERLTAGFPWIAGRVVVQGRAKGNTGICKIKPFERIPRLVVRDYGNDPSAPSMDGLRDAGFPLSLLDESLFAPISTLPAETEYPDGRPVFMVQATFISGGVILTFTGEHRSMDITGQNQIIHLLHKACSNEPFSPDELSLGNQPRHNIIPLLDDHEAQLLDARPPPEEVTTTPSPLLLPSCTWACFNFPSASLTSLKTLATESLLTDYISTDDALSAFIWQSILRARLPRLPPAAESTLLRAIDLRPSLSLPSTYPGLAMTVVPSTAPLPSLTTQPLGHAASRLRQSLNPRKLSSTARAFAAHLAACPDKSRVPFAPNVDPATNVMFSSWSKIGLYGLDFHLGLGAPEAVRRPRLFPVEGLVYAMPRDRVGGIAVQVCLRGEDLGRLRGDEAFGRFAVYIG